jgi:hypothetical protein
MDRKLTTIGVLLVVGGIIMALATARRLISDGRVALQSAQSDSAPQPGFRGCPDPRPTPAQLTMPVTVKVPVGRPFLIELRSTDPQAYKREYRVSCVGLEISPSDWISPAEVEGQQGLVARWSARANDPGELFPVINVRSSGVAARINDKICKWYVGGPSANSTVVPNDRPFRIIVLSGPTYDFQHFGPYLAAFFGSLLTLPGLLAFVQERRKRRADGARIQVVQRPYPPNVLH